MAGTLSATVRQDTPPVIHTAGGSGGWGRAVDKEVRRPVYGDMAASISGTGTMHGRLQANASLRCNMAGGSSFRALPVLDITRLLQRRREEEEMMVWILEAMG